MGYETKMYVCQLSDYVVDEDGTVYAMPVAMVDLCKTGSGAVGSLIHKQTTKDPVVYMYATDGNTRLIWDSYGDALGVISVDDMIDALKKEGTEYRRFKIALAVLEAAKDTFKDIYVVTEGH